MIQAVVEPPVADGVDEPAGGALPASVEASDNPVQLGNTLMALAVLRAHPERFARLCEQTKATVGYAECLCTTPAKRLVIRTRSGKYHLACWPGQRGQHAAGCHFHFAPHLSGRSRYAATAIEEDSDGVRIHLAAPLTLSLHAARRRAIQLSGVQVGAPSRTSMSLLGLLDLLWDLAGLHRWPGRRGRRSWRECARHLADAVDETRLDRIPLASVLHLIPPYTPDTAAAHDAALSRFINLLGIHGSVVRHGLILGELRALVRSKHGWRIDLRHTRTSVFADDALLTRLRRSHPAVFSAVRPDDARQVVLLLADRAPRGYLRLVDAAARLCSRDYLPAESSFEVRMADHLVAAGRRFVKPLRFDHVEEVFPDFVLVDDDPPTAVEVWGIRGRVLYEERRRAKRRIYADRSTTLALLEWDVNEPLPDVRRQP